MVISIIHDKSEEIQCFIDGKRQKVVKQSNCCSVVNVDCRDESFRVLIRQKHKFNCIWWPLYLLIVIPFFQGLFVPYEKKSIKDYFAQVEFTAKKLDTVLTLNLKKEKYNSPFKKRFYLSLNAIRGLPDETLHNGYYYYFECLKGNETIIDFNANPPIPKIFAFKWVWLRFWPELVLFGGMAIGCGVSVFNEICNNGSIESILWGIFAVIAIITLLFVELFRIIKYTK